MPTVDGQNSAPPALPLYTPAFNVEHRAHAFAGNTCVREALADEQGESKNQNHNMHAILNAGVKGGSCTMMARMACTTHKK